jgi:hypothetical protein
VIRLGVVAIALSLAAPAWAGDDDIENALEKTAAPGAPAKKQEEILPEIGEDKLQDFVLERGVYFTGDIGLFESFGGVQGVSNIQPYMQLAAGFDINNFVSVQIAFATGYVSQNPVSANDLPAAGGNETTNYGLMMLGGEVVGALRPTARFAIEPKVGGGISFINPEITSPADTRTSLGPTSPHVAFGLDFKYLTLLTDFTAGISVTGYYLVTPSVLCLAEAFVVRYTF